MTDPSRLRIVVLRVVVLSILLTLFGRLAYLQVAEGSKYRAAASSNRVREIITPAARGQLLDDRGVALAGNRTALLVSVTRSIVRSQPHRGAQVLARLSKVIGIPAAQIAVLITPCGEKLKGGGRAKAGDNLVLSVDAKVQKVVEDALAKGIQDARTHLDRNRGANYKAPDGAAIVMEAATGRIVAMASYPTYNPTVFVGGISTKEYRGLLDAPGHPLISNAVQGLYAPGSSFKIVSTAGAIKAGYPLTPRIYPCPGQFRIGNSVKRNFEGESFATLDFRETLIRSCDTVYYKLAVEQWTRDGGSHATKNAQQVFVNMARSWGFGAKTGIDLPDEKRGLITDRGYKQRYWQQNKAIKCKRARTGYPEVAKTDQVRAALLLELAKEFCTDGYRYNAGDAANFVIGQGDVLVTPLQLAGAYSSMVNGGTRYQPQLAKGFVAADGKTFTPIAPVKTGTLPVSRTVLDYMTSALAGVVRPPGTAKASFAGFPFGQLQVGGKTGTADVNGKSPTSWFASFAPANAPKYVTVVMVPEGGTGGTTAAPIARKIWDGMYGLEGAKPALSNGTLPAGLPVVRTDGTVAPPGTKVPVPPRVVRPTPTASPSGGTRALGGPADLPWAEERRRTPLGLM